MQLMAKPASAPWHGLDPDSVLQRLRTGRSGLTAAEAEARLSRHGPNALRTAPPVPWWRILVAQLRGVVVWLLIAACVVALLMGDAAEAVAIAVVLVLNALRLDAMGNAALTRPTCLSGGGGLVSRNVE